MAILPAMLARFFRRLLLGSAADVAPPEPRERLLSTDAPLKPRQVVADIINARLKAAAPKLVGPAGAAMDSMDLNDACLMTDFAAPNVSDALFNWFGLQTFIGHQMCAILAQHWLIEKACSMPGRDAIRNGFEIVLPDTADGAVSDQKDEIEEANKRLHLNRHLFEFVRQGRIFGIRVAIFTVDLGDKARTDAFYENPFNADAVTPDSYKGIVQVDPYWMTPEFDAPAISDPTSPGFYEPTWWKIGQRKYHVSHLAVFKTAEPADILKPSYMWGGVPVPQRIMERVYAAERTANEAPQLAMTKRLNVWKTDLSHILVNQEKFGQHMQNFAAYRDNYGVKLIDSEDEMAQFDTTLTGFNELVMAQYEIVAAASNVPATKLLGTQPKGFNSAGGYEESSYHEELETIQTHDLTPFLDRHLQLLSKSEFKGVAIKHEWNPLDSMDAKEEAEVNYVKAQTDDLLASAGAIDGEDIRNRVRGEKGSGYTGISAEVPEPEPDPAAIKVNPTKPASIKNTPDAVS